MSHQPAGRDISKHAEVSGRRKNRADEERAERIWRPSAAWHDRLSLIRRCRKAVNNRDRNYTSAKVEKPYPGNRQRQLQVQKQFRTKGPKAKGRKFGLDLLMKLKP